MFGLLLWFVQSKYIMSYDAGSLIIPVFYFIKYSLYNIKSKT